MSITLTDNAANRIKAYMENQQGVMGLRLGVAKSGCSGFSYLVDFADHVAPDDVVFESRGVRVIVNPESLAFVDGTEVDFGREGLNETFLFRNPNVAATCGCGESFTVEQGD